MRSSDADGGLVLLDACCLINLFATDRVEEILRALPFGFGVARFVAEEEVLEIEPARSGREDLDGGRRPRVDLSRPIRALITAGLLQELDVSSSIEYQELIYFATQLDDGEAHTFALALTRGARVATDDKKAIRTFLRAWEKRFGMARAADSCLRTSELFFEWARIDKIRERDLENIVRSIAQRASFFPRRNDPHFERWMGLLGQENGE